MHFIYIALNDSNLKTCKNLYILSDIVKWVNASQGLEHRYQKIDMLGKQTVWVTNKAKWEMF